MDRMSNIATMPEKIVGLLMQTTGSADTVKINRFERLCRHFGDTFAKSNVNFQTQVMELIDNEIKITFEGYSIFERTYSHHSNKQVTYSISPSVSKLPDKLISIYLDYCMNCVEETVLSYKVNIQLCEETCVVVRKRLLQSMYDVTLAQRELRKLSASNNTR